LMLMCISAVNADLLISGVLYDPEGTDTGKEWIEIFNPTDNDISLEGYVIQSGNGAAEDSWTLELNGTSDMAVPAHGYFLIGEIDVLPTPDHITALDLQNGPDSCRITTAGHSDTIGWGTLLFDEYYEGSPATDVSDTSLSRYSYQLDNITYHNDSDDNSVDLFASSRIPRSSSGQSIDITYEVAEDQISLACTIEDDDTYAAGYQIAPVPGDVRDMIVQCNVSHDSDCSIVVVTVDDMELASSAYNSTHCSLEGYHAIDFDEPPGNYTLTINATDSASMNSTTLVFTYLSLSAFEMDTSTLEFPQMKKADTYTIAGDFQMDTVGRPSIRNIGNTKIDLGVIGTDLSGTLGVGLISYVLEATQTFTGSLKPTLEVIDTDLNPSESASLSLTLDIPSNATQGTYQANALFMAMIS